MSVDVLRLKRLYFEAVDLGLDERRAFLAEHCGADEELRTELARMLERSSGSDSMLPSPHLDLSEPERDPERIGPYRILRRIGAGGMGTVYLAEQAAPIAREVAIKVVKAGLDGRRFLARFERERHALARMEHENVARIYDAGETVDGQPFLAMEFVDGVPIHRFCDQRDATLRERVALFRQVCAGVQHAHQKGVVHRDLKPDNVLVVERGGRAVVKVIDFGLARARAADPEAGPAPSDAEWAGSQLQVGTLVGAVLGTPEYMAPEQARGEIDAIDTRTDVFALGALLYELLSGVLPVDSMRLRRATPREVEQLICDREPESPSTRLSSVSDEQLAEAAARRRLRERDLARALRHELDWIVLRAIDRDPARRYPSADALSQDLALYLIGLPVDAVPGSSGGYRLRKLLRRQAGLVAALVVVLAGLAAGAVTVRSNFVEAEEHQRRFDELATLGHLQRALEWEPELTPAWPERLPEMRAWQDLAEQQVLGQVDRIRAALEALSAGLEPVDEAGREATREQHPRYPELQQARARRTSLARAAAIAGGEEVFEPVPLDPSVHDAPDGDLWGWVGERVRYDRTVFGEEAPALGTMRVLAAREELDYLSRGEIEWMLAWACFSNGLLDEAREHIGRCLHGGAWLHGIQEVERLHDAFLEALEAFPQAVSEARARVTELEAALVAWQWPDDTDQFLHDALQRALPEIRALEDATDRVAQRVRWAGQVAEFTVDGPEVAARWRAAREALATADGESASELYSEVPIVDLEPQLGLIPLGKNPATGLWEFYHPRSAWDAGRSEPIAEQCAAPRRRAGGPLDLPARPGIVFVLIPGQRIETPDRPALVIEPCFVGAHELTAGQWLRLSEPGKAYETPEPGTVGVRGHRVTERHPVAYVDWQECRGLLRKHGLRLPTGEEWDRAALAGAETAFYTGDDPSSLTGHAYLQATVPDGIEADPRTSLPVGSLLASPFGLYDVYGNLSEWTETLPRDSGGRLRRGGAWFDPPTEAARSAKRISQEGMRDRAVGVRPVRSILRSGTGAR